MRLSRAKLAVEMIRQDVNGKWLAKASGLSRSTITGVKSGKSCSDETAKKIAEALCVNVLDLIESEMKK